MKTFGQAGIHTFRISEWNGINNDETAPGRRIVCSRSYFSRRIFLLLERSCFFSLEVVGLPGSGMASETLFEISVMQAVLQSTTNLPLRSLEVS